MKSRLYGIILVCKYFQEYPAKKSRALFMAQGILLMTCILGWLKAYQAEKGRGGGGGGGR